LSAPNLTREQAIARAATVSVENYRIELDLTGQPTDPAAAAGETFFSRSTVTFSATPGAETFVDIVAAGVRSAEPSLARAAGGALLPREASVDPREVCAALLASVEVRAEPRPEAEARVVATGAALPPPWTALVSGVRGEIVRLRSDDPPCRTVRGWVGGEPVYLVPRGDGRVVLGATSEAHEAAPVVTAGGVLRLLAAARTLWPALDRAELVETTARDRPASADGLPLVGPSGVDGVVLAAGHYRHGVLLAPLTARLVADHLENGAVEPTLDPRRFAGPPQGAR